MYEFLKASTAVFVLQVIAGAIAWSMTDGDLVLTLLIAGIVTFAATLLSILFVFIPIFDAGAFFACVAIAELTALATGFIIFIVNDGRLGATGITIFCSFVVASSFLFAAGILDFAALDFAAKEARGDGAQEPKWAIALAAMPAGIGTVVGGAVYYFLFRADKRSMKKPEAAV